MKSVLVTLLSLTGLLAVSTGLDVADMPPVMRTDSSALATGSADIPTDASENPDTNLTKLNATVAGNNQIIVIGDQAKKGVVDFIKNLVMKGSSPQDDDALSTQIITVLGGDNSTATNSDLATKMVPKIKKPAQLRQIIVKLTEMSPKFDATEVGDHDA
ncbi:hypothetical protein GQ600_5513 [Phytophthora cactorum]|nr:hypothetical protein GQ600_5513 [Phytophthora cactorum]